MGPSPTYQEPAYAPVFETIIFSFVFQPSNFIQYSLCATDGLQNGPVAEYFFFMKQMLQNMVSVFRIPIRGSLILNYGSRSGFGRPIKTDLDPGLVAEFMDPLKES
jgi:hypothetical protein